VKIKKEPGDEGVCACSALFFTRSFLQHFYFNSPFRMYRTQAPSILKFEKYPLLDNLFSATSLFADLNQKLVPEELALLKVTEAITLLRLISADTDLLLSDISEPRKIDLADFMQKNFVFNIPIKRFAHLTGRSLATFKRDFKKTFGTTPQKWLTRTRLAKAHFLIAEKHQRPSRVYIEVGFENFSHFTFSFKNQFGYNPSSIAPVNK